MYKGEGGMLMQDYPRGHTMQNVTLVTCTEGFIWQKVCKINKSNTSVPTVVKIFLKINPLKLVHHLVDLFTWKKAICNQTRYGPKSLNPE